MKINLIIMITALVFLIGCNEKKSMKENSNDTQQEVFEAHDKRRVATLNSDANTVASMMTDDLTFTHANAVVENKTQFIEALKTRRLQYQDLTDEDITVRVHGSTGVVSGICRILVDASGTMIDIRVEFTELWVKEQESWKMMLWHATEVK